MAGEIMIAMDEPPPASHLDDPEPQLIDERISAELERAAISVGLRSRPNGEEQCGGCRFYRNAEKAISYCWQPNVRMLVGSAWWCQWWESPD
jgi:hypothetical protein